MTTNEFWKDRRVMVTGGRGFLGTYIVRKLREQCAEVFVVDVDRYDLRRVGDIRRALADCRPQMVIHLAARVGGIVANQEHPAEFFYENLMMGVSLLEEGLRGTIEGYLQSSKPA